MNLDKKSIIAIMGPSGAGKGTILAEAKKQGLEFALSISVTTRSPRGTEVDGINYFFKTHKQVEEMIKNDELLESKKVYDQIYGTSKKFVEDNLNKGIDVVLEIDTQGALEVKSKMPEAVLIFIVPKDLDTLHSRLVGRGTENEEQVAKRFGKAQGEIAQAIDYDYLLINDKIEQCAAQFINIIEAERLRTSREINKQIIASFN